MADGLLVRPCSFDAARTAVLRWHYSKRMPPPKLNHFGVWESGRFVGAVIFGRGATANPGSPYGLDQTEICELVRVALRDHQAPVTQIVAEAIRQLRARNPRLRLIVSFADPNVGHHGGIYQAGNWIYAGQTDPVRFFRDAHGRELHPRVVSPTGWKKQYGRYKRVPKPQDLTPIMRAGKHRYLMPLDRAMRRRVAKLAQPYPPAGEGSTVSHPGPTGEVPVQPRPPAPSEAR